MIQKIPARADSANLLPLAADGEKDFMLITLMNGPGSSKYTFTGRKNRSYTFTKRPGERKHTLYIPKSVWDAKDAEVAIDILGKTTQNTFIVQHVSLDNPAATIKRQTSLPTGPAVLAPEEEFSVPEPSDEELLAAASSIIDGPVTLDEDVPADPADEPEATAPAKKRKSKG